MSQQYPGQPGGVGGGPPGYGGPYGGNPGPGAGQPYGAGGYPGGPGYPQNPMPVQPPPKKSKVWLFAGLGCGFLILVAIAATLFTLYWMKNKAEALRSDVERQLANASSMPQAPVAPGGQAVQPASGEATGDCQAALTCCKSIADKTGNAEAVKACDVFKMAGYPQASCAAALTGYRQVAKATGAVCE